MLKGTLAAAVTPLRDGGAALDEDAFGPYVEFLRAGGLDGILALGTTGEGILLVAGGAQAGGRRSSSRPPVTASTWPCTAARRRRATPWSSLRHAAEQGADAVAVIGPPYYALDEEALVRAFRRGGRGLRPAPLLPLRVSRDRSGYSIPLSAIERLRELAPNLAASRSRTAVRRRSSRS